MCCREGREKKISLKNLTARLRRWKLKGEAKIKEERKETGDEGGKMSGNVGDGKEGV